MRLAVLAGSLAVALGLATVALLVADRAVGRLLGPRFTPLGGPPDARTVLARPEFRVAVRTNAAGFRGGPLPGPKPADVYRVVVLGDSFTWGYGVRERQAYPARLAARLTRATGGRPRVEVVNLGVPGSGPLDHLHHLAETGLGLAPDLVVIGLFVNDVNDLYQVRRFGARSPLWVVDELRGTVSGSRPWWRRTMPRAFPNLSVLVARTAARLGGPRAARAAGDEREAVDREALVAALGERYARREAVLARYRALPPPARHALDQLLGGDLPLADMRPVLLLGALVDPDAELDGILLRSDERRVAWAETADVLSRMIRLAHRHGAATAIVLVPASEQIDRSRWDVLRAAGYRLDPALLDDTRLADLVGALARREGAVFVDLLAAFRARRGRTLYFQVDEHWNPRGHAFAANRIADHLLPLIPRGEAARPRASEEGRARRRGLKATEERSARLDRTRAPHGPPGRPRVPGAARPRPAAPERARAREPIAGRRARRRAPTGSGGNGGAERAAPPRASTARAPRIEC